MKGINLKLMKFLVSEERQNETKRSSLDYSSYSNLPPKDHPLFSSAKENFLAQWWLHPVNHLKIIEISERILGKFPTGRIFSLGQSPAWLAKGCEILRRRQGINQEIGYIPFSGSFLHVFINEEVGRSFRVCLKDKSEEVEPDEIAVIKYKNLLQSLGMSPKIIIAKARQGKKTVIIDYIESGESLASFIYFILNWAKKEKILKQMLDSIQISTLCSKIYDHVDSCSLYFPQLDIEPIKCEKIEIKRNDEVLMLCLVKLADRIRLVPNYSYKLWKTVPLTPTGMLQQSLTQGLEQIVERRLSPAVVPGTGSSLLGMLPEIASGLGVVYNKILQNEVSFMEKLKQNIWCFAVPVGAALATFAYKQKEGVTYYISNVIPRNILMMGTAFAACALAIGHFTSKYLANNSTEKTKAISH